MKLMFAIGLLVVVLLAGSVYGQECQEKTSPVNPGDVSEDRNKPPEGYPSQRVIDAALKKNPAIARELEQAKRASELQPADPDSPISSSSRQSIWFKWRCPYHYRYVFGITYGGQQCYIIWPLVYEAVCDTESCIHTYNIPGKCVEQCPRTYKVVFAVCLGPDGWYCRPIYNLRYNQFCDCSLCHYFR